MPTRLEKYWAESGRGDGQGDVEKEYISAVITATLHDGKSQKKVKQFHQKPSFNRFEGYRITAP